jgi:hypothetical protein
MSFSWNEIAAIGLLKFLLDPELVIYFMRTLKHARRDLIEEEARSFHESLRITMEERWKSTHLLRKVSDFHKMNPSVPITCNLPFDCGMWRRSCMMLKSIRFFRPNFIRNRAHPPLNDFTPKLSKLIDAVDHICNSVGEESSSFRNGWSYVEISEALNDLEIYEEGGNDMGGEIDPEQRFLQPYLLIYISEQDPFAPQWERDHILEIVN